MKRMRKTKRRMGT